MSLVTDRVRLGRVSTDYSNNGEEKWCGDHKDIQRAYDRVVYLEL